MKKLLLYTIILLCIITGCAYLMCTGMIPSPPGSFSFSSLFSTIAQISNPSGYIPLEVSENDLDSDGSNVFRYYYEQLSEEEKQLYIQLYVIARDQLTNRQINTTDSDTATRVMEYVLLDNPQIFYVDNWNIETKTSTAGTYMSLRTFTDMSKSDQRLASSAINGYLNTFMVNIRSDMTDYEKAVCLFQYLVEHTEYDKNAPYNQNLYSVALGSSVCKGYTCAYKYLCDQMGIPCISLTGTMEEPHAWNMVQLDGEWCHVDCTSGDDIHDPVSMTDYSWFGLNDETILKTHTIDDAGLLPACTTVANSYYLHNNLYFETFELDVLKTQFAGGHNFSFQCASTETFNQACKVLKNSADLGNYLYSIGMTKISYIPNESTNTLFVLLE